MDGGCQQVFTVVAGKGQQRGLGKLRTGAERSSCWRIKIQHWLEVASMVNLHWGQLVKLLMNRLIMVIRLKLTKLG